MQRIQLLLLITAAPSFFSASEEQEAQKAVEVRKEMSWNTFSKGVGTVLGVFGTYLLVQKAYWKLPFFEKEKAELCAKISVEAKGKAEEIKKIYQQRADKDKGTAPKEGSSFSELYEKYKQEYFKDLKKGTQEDLKKNEDEDGNEDENRHDIININ